MNLLYLLDNPQLYGSEIHLFDILSHEVKNNKVYLITFKNGPLIEKINKELPDVRISIIESGYFISKRKLKIIKNLVIKNKIQLIHAHQPKALFIGTFIKIRTKIPLVETIHSQPIDHALVQKGLKKILVYLFHSLINYWSQKNADKIIFVSNYMLAKTKSLHNSIKIYNWIRPSLLIDNYEKNVNVLHNKKIIFFCCGSVTKSKGFDNVLKFCQILNSNPEINFEIKVAGGIDEKFMESQRKNFPKEVFDKIVFLGYIADLTSLYQEADFFVLFSRSETFGLVYVEAMSFGLPIIASDIPILHEIIPNNNCITNNLKESVIFVSSLIKDDKNYKEISKQNVKYAISNFKFENAMNKLDFLYSELIG